MAKLSKEIIALSNAPWFPTMMEKLEYVKVIRCKVCTKYKHWECPIEQAGYRPKEDGYCFDAERRTE